MNKKQRKRKYKQRKYANDIRSGTTWVTPCLYTWNGIFGRMAHCLVCNEWGTDINDMIKMHKNCESKVNK